MFVTYSPEGDEAARTWEFRPGRVKTSRCQMIEKRLREIGGGTKTYDQFKGEVVQGSAAARRVLLWHLLSLDHPTLRIEDVDPLADELLVEHSRQELQEIRGAVAKVSTIDTQEREIMLDALDGEIKAAKDDGGKSPLEQLWERYALAISETHGIKPWEQLELLSVDMFLAAVNYIDRLNEEAQKARQR